MKYLITGIQSGLGKYLHETLGGQGFTRKDQVNEQLFETPFDVIIHCAFNSRANPNNNELYPYLEDNIFLTRNLMKIKCKKFIYISSIDIYDKTENKLHFEDEKMPINDNLSLYQIAKLSSENIVKYHQNNYLIIRPGLLFGKYMRSNNILRLLTENNPRLSLTEDSEFNCVTYEDLLEFILIVVKQDLVGTFNAVSNNVLALNELAKIIKKPARFGTYHYKTGNISNEKIKNFCKYFNKSSLETIKYFMGKLYEN